MFGRARSLIVNGRYRLLGLSIQSIFSPSSISYEVIAPPVSNCNKASIVAYDYGVAQRSIFSSNSNEVSGGEEWMKLLIDQT